jgi:hypothetical protein
MRPIEFEQMTHRLAEDQPEYQPLPCHISADGTITSCWELTDEEALTLATTKKLWLQTMTFRQPMQPILPMAEDPWMPDGLPMRIATPPADPYFWCDSPSGRRMIAADSEVPPDRCIHGTAIDTACGDCKQLSDHDGGGA